VNMGKQAKKQDEDLKIAFIGTAGVPNRYGGFEAFLECCGPEIAKLAGTVYVTCDAQLYTEREPDFRGMRRVFIGVRANGTASVLHDLLAFFAVFWRARSIVVLGVSGAPWFPLFRLLCELTGKKLLVNVDGVEWRRGKFSALRRGMLRVFDALAQTFAHRVIYDNTALEPYLLANARSRAVELRYSGDHVLRLPHVQIIPGTALTICRIEPENNVDMLIAGALLSGLEKYIVVGNWNNGEWGRALRAKYQSEPRVELLDPIYDQITLARLRGSAAVYLHGHSVGGTNPSLVEMLYYDCRLLCIDVAFHHHTVGDCASYFSSAETLGALLDAAPGEQTDRTWLRSSYTAEIVAASYVAAIAGVRPAVPWALENNGADPYRLHK
jgi:glycosyltransferase involved in cell wall biosynthesis